LKNEQPFLLVNGLVLLNDFLDVKRNGVNTMKKSAIVLMLTIISLSVGCTHPMRKLDRLQLGMSPDEVREQMGKPYAPRSAKVFKDEQTTFIWEYWPPILTFNEQKIHLYFENDRLVQWGVPGDFGTGTGSRVTEYKETKSR